MSAEEVQLPRSEKPSLRFLRIWNGRKGARSPADHLHRRPRVHIPFRFDFRSPLSSPLAPSRGSGGGWKLPSYSSPKVWKAQCLHLNPSLSSVFHEPVQSTPTATVNVNYECLKQLTSIFNRQEAYLGSLLSVRYSKGVKTRLKSVCQRVAGRD